MGSDTNLNGASPFVHHLVNAHLEHLSVPEGSAAQYHAMIEVISGTEDMASGAQLPTRSVCQGLNQPYQSDTHCPETTRTSHTRHPPVFPPQCPTPY